eukprot:gene11905-8187_t
MLKEEVEYLVCGSTCFHDVAYVALLYVLFCIYFLSLLTRRAPDSIRPYYFTSQRLTERLRLVRNRQSSPHPHHTNKEKTQALLFGLFHTYSSKLPPTSSMLSLSRKDRLLPLQDDTTFDAVGPVRILLLPPLASSNSSPSLPSRHDEQSIATEVSNAVGTAVSSTGPAPSLQTRVEPEAEGRAAAVGRHIRDWWSAPPMQRRAAYRRWLKSEVKPTRLGIKLRPFPATRLEIHTTVNSSSATAPSPVVPPCVALKEHVGLLSQYEKLLCPTLLCSPLYAPVPEESSETQRQPASPHAPAPDADATGLDEGKPLPQPQQRTGDGGCLLSPSPPLPAATARLLTLLAQRAMQFCLPIHETALFFTLSLLYLDAAAHFYHWGATSTKQTALPPLKGEEARAVKAEGGETPARPRGVHSSSSSETPANANVSESKKDNKERTAKEEEGEALLLQPTGAGLQPVKPEKEEEEEKEYPGVMETTSVKKEDINEEEGELVLEFVCDDEQERQSNKEEAKNKIKKKQVVPEATRGSSTPQRQRATSPALSPSPPAQRRRLEKEKATADEWAPKDTHTDAAASPRHGPRAGRGAATTAAAESFSDLSASVLAFKLKMLQQCPDRETFLAKTTNTNTNTNTTTSSSSSTSHNGAARERGDAGVAAAVEDTLRGDKDHEYCLNPHEYPHAATSPAAAVWLLLLAADELELRRSDTISRAFPVGCQSTAWSARDRRPGEAESGPETPTPSYARSNATGAGSVGSITGSSGSGSTSSSSVRRGREAGGEDANHQQCFVPLFPRSTHTRASHYFHLPPLPPDPLQIFFLPLWGRVMMRCVSTRGALANLRDVLLEEASRQFSAVAKVDEGIRQRNQQLQQQQQEEIARSAPKTQRDSTDKGGGSSTCFTSRYRVTEGPETAEEVTERERAVAAAAAKRMPASHSPPSPHRAAARTTLNQASSAAVEEEQTRDGAVAAPPSSHLAKIQREDGTLLSLGLRQSSYVIRAPVEVSWRWTSSLLPSPSVGPGSGAAAGGATPFNPFISWRGAEGKVLQYGLPITSTLRVIERCAITLFQDKVLQLPSSSNTIAGEANPRFNRAVRSLTSGSSAVPYSVDELGDMVSRVGAPLRLAGDPAATLVLSRVQVQFVRAVLQQQLPEVYLRCCSQGMVEWRVRASARTVALVVMGHNGREGRVGSPAQIAATSVALFRRPAAATLAQRSMEALQSALRLVLHGGLEEAQAYRRFLFQVRRDELAESRQSPRLLRLVAAAGMQRSPDVLGKLTHLQDPPDRSTNNNPPADVQRSGGDAVQEVPVLSLRRTEEGALYRMLQSHPYALQLLGCGPRQLLLTSTDGELLLLRQCGMVVRWSLEACYTCASGGGRVALRPPRRVVWIPEVLEAPAMLRRPGQRTTPVFTFALVRGLLQHYFKSLPWGKEEEKKNEEGTTEATGDTAVGSNATSSSFEPRTVLHAADDTLVRHVLRHHPAYLSAAILGCGLAQLYVSWEWGNTSTRAHTDTPSTTDGAHAALEGEDQHPAGAVGREGGEPTAEGVSPAGETKHGRRHRRRVPVLVLEHTCGALTPCRSLWRCFQEEAPGGLYGHQEITAASRVEDPMRWSLVALLFHSLPLLSFPFCGGSQTPRDGVTSEWEKKKEIRLLTAKQNKTNKQTEYQLAYPFLGHCLTHIAIVDSFCSTRNSLLLVLLLGFTLRGIGRRVRFFLVCVCCCWFIDFHWRCVLVILSPCCCCLLLHVVLQSSLCEFQPIDHLVGGTRPLSLLPYAAPPFLILAPPTSIFCSEGKKNWAHSQAGLLIYTYWLGQCISTVSVFNLVLSMVLPMLPKNERASATTDPSPRPPRLSRTSSGGGAEREHSPPPPPLPMLSTPSRGGAASLLPPLHSPASSAGSLFSHRSRTPPFGASPSRSPTSQHRGGLHRASLLRCIHRPSPIPRTTPGAAIQLFIYQLLSRFGLFIKRVESNPASTLSTPPRRPSSPHGSTPSPSPEWQDFSCSGTAPRASDPAPSTSTPPLMQRSGATFSYGAVDNAPVDIDLSSRLQGSRTLPAQLVVIEGMSCTSCASRVETAVSKLDGVAHCAVDFTSSTASVTTSAGTATAEVMERVQQLIEELGYRVTSVTAAQMDTSALEAKKNALERTEELRRLRFSCICSAILSVPVLIIMFYMMTGHHASFAVELSLDLVQLVCVTPVVLYFGRIFFIGAWRSLTHLTFTMDTLVAIGTGLTYLYSVAAVVAEIGWRAGLSTYFDTAGLLTTFMLLGRFLEANAKRQTGGALLELMNLVPPTATLGAHLRVLAGDRVPVDGSIVEGLTEIDEQMVTGESVPRPASPGDKVVGGTLNVGGAIVIRAEKVGEDTMLANILRIVQDAQSSKPAVQRIADRMAMYFVPTVLVIALATLVTWLVLGATNAYPEWYRGSQPWTLFAFEFFIATVVAACPCALGLATPTAIMVGAGVGARNGVLVKSAAVLEAVHKATCVVFDKTGTLTTGKLTVVEVLWLEKIGTTSIASCRITPAAIAVSAALEAEAAASERRDPKEAHRLGKAETLEVRTHHGEGLQARVRFKPPRPGGSGGGAAPSRKSETHEVLLGNERLLRRFGAQRSLGRTLVFGVVDGSQHVVLSLSDTVKPEARGVVAALQDLGLRTMVVTGDHRTAAEYVAASVGIPSNCVHADVLPVDKASIVRQAQADGYRVVFVGDGINDGPALVQADVGVALGAGTEVAIEAADAVLIRDSLVDLLNLRDLSTLTVRRVYGNFVWAIGYNLVILPLACGALFPYLHYTLPPLLAGLAMICSSLCVLLSSLSIRCFRPRVVEEVVRYHSRYVSGPV